MWTYMLSEVLTTQIWCSLTLQGSAAFCRSCQTFTPARSESLTPRETDTLRLIAKSYANELIARELNTEERTVKTHVSN
ncbi:MAG: response regulator transcription factor [Deinococcales bacterium]